MRGRDVVSALVGLGVVAGVLAGGWWLLTEEDEPGAAGDRTAAAELADEYVAAWEAGDLERMAALVRDESDDFRDAHRQLEEALAPRSVELTPDEVRETADGRAVVPVEVALELEAFDEPVTWRTELELVRVRGQWGVDWASDTIHPELRSTSSFAIRREEVAREPITAADGTQLAGPGEEITFGFQPALVEDTDEVVEAFEDAIPGSGDRARSELTRGDLNPDWFYPVVTVGPDRADAASPRLREASGILRRTSEGERVLHDDDFARHLVGVVDEATAEQLEQLGDAAEPGHRLGQFGLEAAFEDQLVGSEEIRVGVREDDEGPLRVVIATTQEDPSAPVRTTIDVTVQRAVENALTGVDDPAAIVVVDGSTGAVVATASRPLGGYNRAFAGRYPPGSTFKIVTAEALLASGASPDDQVDCPARTVVGGLAVDNAGDRDLGTVTFAEAFAESCNTSFARLAAELGPEDLEAAARRFGFGADAALPVNAFLGSFPTPADTAELAASAFGQGRVEASPLHLASVAAAVLEGAWRPPYVLADQAEGESRSLSPGTASPLRELLRLAVTDGTGDAAAASDEPVGGKTGTAQGAGGIEHAWFVGTWEGLGFAVLVEEGGGGGEVAAPLAGRLVSELAALRGSDGPDGGA